MFVNLTEINRNHRSEGHKKHGITFRVKLNDNGHQLIIGLPKDIAEQAQINPEQRVEVLYSPDERYFLIRT